MQKVGNNAIAKLAVDKMNTLKLFAEFKSLRRYNILRYAV